MTLGILIAPHTNARYFSSIKDLSLCEMTLMNGVVGANDPEYRTIGGLELLCIEIKDADVPHALPVLQRHSACQAVFSVEGELLRPLRLPGEFPFDRDIASILKYKGKTNERFTTQMINLAVFSGDYAREYGSGLKIFDPMCGRATSLLEGLRLGYDVSGIEINRNDVKEANQFIKSYLQVHKVKHTIKRDSMTANGKEAGERTQVSLSGGQMWTLLCGDTLSAASFFKRDTFHALTVDLPYGIQTIGHSGQKRAQIDALLRRALPIWRRLIKPGAAIVMAFNAHAVSLDAMRAMLAEAGYEVLRGGSYDKMRHWVEQAIDRDVAVALRPR
jgi:hypothetical protein